MHGHRRASGVLDLLTTADKSGWWRTHAPLATAFGDSAAVCGEKIRQWGDEQCVDNIRLRPCVGTAPEMMGLSRRHGCNVWKVEHETGDGRTGALRSRHLTQGLAGGACKILVTRGYLAEAGWCSGSWRDRSQERTQKGQRYS